MSLPQKAWSFNEYSRKKKRKLFWTCSRTVGGEKGKAVKYFGARAKMWRFVMNRHPRGSVLMDQWKSICINQKKNLYKICFNKIHQWFIKCIDHHVCSILSIQISNNDADIHM